MYRRTVVSSHVAVLAATFAAGAGLAAARPIEPRDARAPCKPQPPLLEVVERSSSLIEDIVHSRHGEIASCAWQHLAKDVVLEVRLAWNRDGVIGAAKVRGGTRAFRRCIDTAFRGAPAQVERRGRGSAKVVVRPSALRPACISAHDSSIFFTPGPGDR